MIKKNVLKYENLPEGEFDKKNEKQKSYFWELKEQMDRNLRLKEREIERKKKMEDSLEI